MSDGKEVNHVILTRLGISDFSNFLLATLFLLRYEIYELEK
jgi:hypothetical protein